MYHIVTPNCCSASEGKTDISGCCTPHFRHFPSSAELKEMLTKYKEQLQKEIEGVDERINELSKKEA
jgi:hypothetical protein